MVSTSALTLLIVSLAIMARDATAGTCDPAVTCNGRGNCTAAGTCQCQQTGDQFVTNIYSGADCSQFTAVWAGDSWACSNSNCSGHGVKNGTNCTCNIEFNTNTTTHFYGNCCSLSYSHWPVSDAKGNVQWLTSGKVYPASSCPTTCGVNGTCTTDSKTCVCSSNVQMQNGKNVTYQYYGPGCAYWRWFYGVPYTNLSLANPNAYSSACSYHGTLLQNGTCACTTDPPVKGVVSEYFGPTCNMQQTYILSNGTSWAQTYSWAGMNWTTYTYPERSYTWNLPQSYQEVWCYCKNASLADQPGGGSCIVLCERNLTCNGHGNCTNGTNSQMCTCDKNWDGMWCDHCKLGFTSSNITANKTCDICAPNWYPLTGTNMCSVYCNASDVLWGCRGHGVCNVTTGKCNCNTGYDGDYCTRCATPNYIYSYYPDCRMCSPEQCNNNGICSKNGSCICQLGFSGAYCDQCTVAAQHFPNCTYTGAAARGAAADCTGSNLALPIILSILITLLVMGCAFGAYKYWQSRQGAGAGGAGKQSNWTDFEKDSSTAYSEL